MHPQQAPQIPPVILEDRVTSGIAEEVFTAFHAVPRRGAEAGGILLGSKSGERILVEDFEPVICEHRFGPSYILSEEDFGGLAESVEWFRTSGTGNLQVLGFYRSQTRADASIDDRDRELMRRFFPDAGSLFLLLTPSRKETIASEWFVLTEGGLLPRSQGGIPANLGSGDSPVPSSDTGSPAAVENPTPAPEKQTEDHPQTGNAYAALLALPPRPRRVEEPEEPEGRNWTWVAAVAALTIAGAILGYRSGSPPAAKQSALVDSHTSPASTVPVSNPAPYAARNPVEAATQSDVSPDMVRDVREALAQWERAMLSGDPNLIGACYAPRLERYFSQSNLSNMEVRRAALQSVARYGKTAILRISDVTLIPLSATTAAASFRKHWQTSGPKVFAGEEQERLTFVKSPDGWKIFSEEETKVYWKQRPRG